MNLNTFIYNIFKKTYFILYYYSILKHSNKLFNINVLL